MKFITTITIVAALTATPKDSYETKLDGEVQVKPEPTLVAKEALPKGALDAKAILEPKLLAKLSLEPKGKLATKLESGPDGKVLAKTSPEPMGVLVVKATAAPGVDQGQGVEPKRV